TQLLLLDTLKIAKQEKYFLGFDEEDVKRVLKDFRPIDYKESIEIGETTITPYDAGHIPGSCMFFIDSEHTLLYTGDFKLSDTRLVKGAELPKEADILITESTYADREHPKREKEEKRFVEFINETLSNDGVVLLPSFAVSRSQEILLILDKYGINATIYMDGMAVTATEIINAYPELQKDYNSLKKALQRLDVRYVEPYQRKRIVKRPCIIIAGSGMLEGGTVLEYLKRIYNRENSSVAFTGFQVPGTAGYELLKTGRINLNGSELKVKARVKKFDFSSHASRGELFKLIEKANPKKIFCIHGDKTEEFAQQIRDMGFDAVSPETGCYEIVL
ncbi:MAG: MBL fold metallo-hydrolase, partial [Candidatus Aenigmarchaeota archaeon]|nr:MBL fold metallo-hydrolase [Candidatus Aenigmarchaeota archaeon]